MTEESRVRARDIVVNTGIWSRRQLRKVRRGLETPDGEVSLDERVALGIDWLPLSFLRESLRARVVYPPVFLLHKPTGHVTSRKREAGAPTVFELFEDPVALGCEPVGRLDRDTSGVLLFTADGQLLHRLTHPRHGVTRTYVAKLTSNPAEEELARLRDGLIELDDGHVPQPTRVERVGDGVVELDLREGKYHEVRRMFAAIGTPVEALHRTCHADVSLDGLEPGGYRRLSKGEVETLCSVVNYTPTRDFLEVEVLDA